MKVKTSAWSGKQEESQMYIAKFKVMAECSGLGGVIDSTVVLIDMATFNVVADKTTNLGELYK